MAGSAAGSASSSVVPLSPKSQQEMSEKLKSLKRRFEEQDEECGSGINRPDERKVRMREEQEHTRAAIKEIESNIQSPQKVPPSPSKSSKTKQDSVVSRSEGDGANGSHAFESPKAANSSQVRTSGQPTTAARSNTLSSHKLAIASSSTTSSQSSSRMPSANGAAVQSHSRSQRTAVRRSQRQAAGGSPSTVAVAAAATHTETASAFPQQPSPAITQQDVLMADGATQQAEATTTDPTLSTSSASLLSSTDLLDFGPTPSMESIVRVAEAAIAAQNAAKMTVAGSPQQDVVVDPNLDPSLITESSSSPTPSSTTTSTASTFVNKPPPVDTTSMDLKASGGTPSATPSSASSNLSNNPYLALATNYPRGSGASPTGHPMFFPYPIFYPGPTTPANPGSPAYPMPYNPYYYLAPPLVPTSNGAFPSPTNFPPQPQQSSPPSPQVTQQTPSPQVDSRKVVKPKRLKAHTVTTKSFSIPMVPRDKNGKPMLPLNVGIMTVISLGNVCMRDHFHTERYIFPVGYEVTRRYLSTIDANAEVVYHCTILDGGDGPKFQIIPSDRPDKPVIAGTATGAWSSIVKQANAIRNRQHSNSVSGPDFFGLGQNTIKHLIQELPSADKLKDYVWQNFVEGGPLGGRHAAVIPALPEEYDASLPIGAYYPRKNETPDSNLPRGLSYYPQHIIAQAESQKVARTSRGQANSVAGPSGSTSLPLNSTTSGSQGLQQTTSTTKTQRTKNGNLLLQEYRPSQLELPPAPSQEAQPQSQKRVTRSSAAAANASAIVPGPASTSATRQSKSTPKTQQNQKQTQPPQPTQTPMSVAAGPPAVNGDRGTPMTFAGIMKAYPGPHLTLMTDSTGAAGT